MSAELMTSERLRLGYVIVLPGIEGRSPLNRSIVRGLVTGGVPYGIEIHDWTGGPLAYFWNLRDRRRHRRQAEVIAGKITAYRTDHPTQPVYVIGHSGGGAMTLFTLERLSASCRATGGILLVSAISPRYEYAPAVENTTRGLWNFSSWGDFLFVGLGTVLCGTCDGRHHLSAGMTGFSRRGLKGDLSQKDGDRRLHEMPYRAAMMRHFNLGGHFSIVNPVFVRHWIAPLVMGADGPPR